MDAFEHGGKSCHKRYLLKLNIDIICKDFKLHLPQIERGVYECWHDEQCSSVIFHQNMYIVDDTLGTMRIILGKWKEEQFK